MKMPFLLALVTLASASFAQTPVAAAADVESADAIIKAVYNVISGAAGEKRNWDLMRSLFTEDARMVAIGVTPTGEVRRRHMTVEDYIKLNGPALETRGFFEKEVARRTEQFGNLVHVWSTYEARSKADDAKPMMRGINSMQLWNDGKRWHVLSIVWQAEDPKNPLPEKYMKSGR
jgi:hypothetical protein